MSEEAYKAIEAAVSKTVQECGVESLEKTSLFANNDPAMHKAQLDQAIALLREALPHVEFAEFLDTKIEVYGPGFSPPSPAEWGVHAHYQQTKEELPFDQFSREMREFHERNAEEAAEWDEMIEDLDWATSANRIRAFLEMVDPTEGEP